MLLRRILMNKNRKELPLHAKRKETENEEKISLNHKNYMLRDLRKKIYENDSLKQEERETIVNDIDNVILGDRGKDLRRK